MSPTFENMSHEQMLKWLDEARSGEIRGAADRLLDAASEIRRIAEDLKVRPQWVEWKGQGADAFRTWSADLANATLRLGDYSEGVSKWLGEASNAVASAQASIPRPEAGARANLEAALAARNDPDASDVARKSAAELIETGRRNREEAAAQMRKLSQTYAMSTSQLASLEKPVFPEIPQAMVSQGSLGRDGQQHRSVPPGEEGASTPGSVGRSAGSGNSVEAASGGSGGTRSVAGASAAPYVARPSAPGAVSMEVDGVAALPDVSSPPATNPVALSAGPRADGVPSSPVQGAVPPVPPSRTGPAGPRGTNGAGGTTDLPRPPVSVPGPTAPGPGPVGRPPGGNGIVGGHAVPPGPARPAVGIPRGTVIGGETARGAAPLGRTSGTSGGVSRVPPITGGAVGGHQQGRGPLRGPAGVGSGANRAGRDERCDRPDYLVEDGETWQQGVRRVVPPVID
ncbi:hypothetical protein ACF08W_14545 [Streptomyces sp. NPDC015144]|uniref:WXG100 family type VII secretion target n=1 Tax=Streptomyces sp. NPDC015144 TaxID=3364944 RepID=UPI0036F8AEC1